MKKLFYFGILGLMLFEIANVYLNMPMPGSQQMQSIDLAYFLYTWRWAFRLGFLGLAALGFWKVWQGAKWWWPALAGMAALVVRYMTNFKMAADTMFYQPGTLQMKTARDNKVPKEKLVIGLAHNGATLSFPVQFICYHIQVLDTLGGVSLMVAYCTFCVPVMVFCPVRHGLHVPFLF